MKLAAKTILFVCERFAHNSRQLNSMMLRMLNRIRLARGKLSPLFPHICVIIYVYYTWAGTSKTANVGLPLRAMPLPCNNVRYRKRARALLHDFSHAETLHDKPQEFMSSMLPAAQE